MPPTLLPDIACVVVCAVAAVTDLRRLQIPNWLTLPAIALGMVLQPLVFGIQQGWPGVLLGSVSAVAGCVLLGLVFGAFGAVRMIGMGDVKLMAAVGALVGWPLALWALVYVTLAGGVLGLLYALARRRLGTVIRNIGRVGRRMVKKKPPEAEPIELTRIPYAVAVLAGSAWAITARYLPAVRVL